MSLSQLRKLDENGVTFRSHIDGAMVVAHAGARRRGAEPARCRHRDAARRMPQAAGDARRRSSARCGCRCAGPSAASARSRARRRAARCSASCRAATMRRCGVESARALVDIGFPGYAIGGLAVGEPQEVMLRDDRRDRAGAAGRPAALPDGRRHAGRPARGGRARHRHVRLRDADPQRPPRARLHALRRRSTCAMRATPPIRARSTRRARARRRAAIRAPICITWCAPTRCSARCCCRRSISPITRS